MRRSHDGFDELLTWTLYVVPLALLSFLSVLVLQSVAPELARVQLLYVLAGFGLFYVVSRVDYHAYAASPWVWYIAVVILLVATLVLGDTIRGSQRWITIAGISLQTSEFVKPLIIVFISTYLATYYPKSIPRILAYTGFYLVPVLLVFVQPDFGTSILLMTLYATSLVAAGMRGLYLVIFTLIAVVLAPLSFGMLKPYQQERLTSFVRPYEDPLGAGYNALQSTIAVGSGQFWGRGLGQGTQSHLRFLPERHSDFIFASLVEELGFVGGVLLLVLYLVLSYALLRTARRAGSDSGSTLVLLSLVLLLLQIFVNVGMNMGIMPVTGLTLPLVSAGGSSVLSFFVIIGICYSVARFHVPLKQREISIKGL